MMTEEEATEIKRKHSAFLLGLPGVVGVGVASDDSGSYGLIIHVDEEDDDLLQNIPKRIKGCAVKIERSGRYRKL
jgi:hypothetical protein